MRAAAIIANLALMLTGILAISQHGLSSVLDDKLVLVLFVLILGSPIISVLSLTVPGSGRWLVLYFRRKALEEECHIETLKAKARASHLRRSRECSTLSSESCMR